MSLKEVRIGKLSVLHAGSYIVPSEAPEITFEFEEFNLRIKISEKDSEDNQKTGISSSVDEENDIYTVVVKHPKNASEFGSLKKPVNFLKRNECIYSFTFRIQKVMKDAYVITITIYKNPEG